tara:strand:- start:569 stop:790 length:222 start_codon:yes stop_codon:yes gene_type:complete
MHWASDCAKRKTTASTLEIKGLEYSFTTKFGKFSVAFYTVSCAQTGFTLTINGNHTSTNSLARAIFKDLENNK